MIAFKAAGQFVRNFAEAQLQLYGRVQVNLVVAQPEREITDAMLPEIQNKSVAGGENSPVGPGVACLYAPECFFIGNDVHNRMGKNFPFIELRGVDIRFFQ